MSIVPPAPGEPRRPLGPRDPGDAWVVAESGEKYWGRFGAAGLLAWDPARGVLLQHRVSWSHHGGTWGIPGGARHLGESAIDGALRESGEEAGVPAAAVRPLLTSVLDLDVWTYTTLVAEVVEPFEPVIADPESNALAWVPLDEVEDLPLHPGFADSWSRLRALLGERPVVVVDGANVVGSVPDGWWRDRAGAAERLLSALTSVGARGVPASFLGARDGRDTGDGQQTDPGDWWFPEFVLVLEGQARSAVTDVGDITVVRAAHEGDDTIWSESARLRAEGRSVTVVTSDRGLRDRVVAQGARVVGARALRDLFSA